MTAPARLLPAAHLCDEEGQGRIPLAQLLSGALQHEWDQGPLKSHSLCLTIYELINIEQLLSGVQARVNPSKHSTKGSGRAVGAAGALLCQGWLQSRVTALSPVPCLGRTQAGQAGGLPLAAPLLSIRSPNQQHSRSPPNPSILITPLPCLLGMQIACLRLFKPFFKSS